ALIALVSFGLTFPGIASVPTPVQAQSQGPRGGGPAGIAPGKRVHLTMTSTPPVTTSSARPMTPPLHDRAGAAAAPTSARTAAAIQTLSSTPPQTVLPGIGTP